MPILFAEMAFLWEKKPTKNGCIVMEVYIHLPTSSFVTDLQRFGCEKLPESWGGFVQLSQQRLPSLDEGLGEESQRLAVLPKTRCVYSVSIGSALLKTIKGTWSAPSLVCGHSQVQLLEDMHNCTSLKSVPPVLFRTNYYSIEILHGVTAIFLTYHPHHAKLQVLSNQ